MVLVRIYFGFHLFHSPIMRGKYENVRLRTASADMCAWQRGEFHIAPFFVQFCFCFCLFSETLPSGRRFPAIARAFYFLRRNSFISSQKETIIAYFSFIENSLYKMHFVVKKY